MTTLHGSLIWYELLADDADAAAAFYRAIVDWTVTPMAGASAGYRMIATKDGGVGGLLPLTAEMVAGGARSAWLMYVGVDDVDATAAQAEAAGGGVSKRAWDVPGIGRMALLTDPQGAPFYIMTPIPPAGGGESNAFSPVLAGHCTWNELRAADLDAAMAFYCGLFGWEEAGSLPMGALGEYKFLSNGLRIGAAMGGATAEPPPHWLHYFRVGSIDDARAAVIEGGGQVLHGPHEVPGGDHVIICRDPQGAGVGFVGHGSITPG